jgi:hypothetical protein
MNETRSPDDHGLLVGSFIDMPTRIRELIDAFLRGQPVETLPDIDADTGPEIGPDTDTNTDTDTKTVTEKEQR